MVRIRTRFFYKSSFLVEVETQCFYYRVFEDPSQLNHLLGVFIFADLQEISNKNLHVFLSLSFAIPKMVAIAFS